MAWLATIAKRLAINEYNKMKHESVTDFTDEVNAFGEVTMPDEDSLGLFKVAQDTLNETDFQIVVMYAVAGYKRREIGKILDLEGEYLARDGRTDVRAHDDADGLRQRHKPRLHEAHSHDRSGAGALDDHSHACTKDHAEQRRLCEHADDVAHALASKELEGVTDELDGVKEEAYAAEQLHRGKKGHDALQYQIRFS